MNDRKEIIGKIQEYTAKEIELRLGNAELKRLYDTLIKADEKIAIHNSIIESSDDGIISKNLNSIITSWNKSASKIFGYSEEEMIGASILKLIPQNLQQQEAEFIKQLTQGIRIEHFKTQRLRKDGTLVDVSLTISPVYDSSGTLVGLSKIVRDITQEKLAEAIGLRLSAIVESSDDAIISKDFDSTITSWNEAATRIFGFNAEEMVGQSIMKIIPKDRYDEEHKILAQLKQGLRVEHFETERLRKDGSLINVSLTISPVKDNNGNIIGLSKIARDITEKSLIEKKKNEFVSFVSHELKTPLTSLKSYLQMALKKPNDVEFILKALAKAESQTKKMERLIQDFLTVSRFEDGNIYIKPTEFDIVKLIAECIENAAVSSNKHSVTYIGAKKIIVNADEEKISLVLTNLISNAQKYSPAGGEIKIKTELSENKVVIKIIDNGIGIAADDQPKMFKKFFRVENEQTKFMPGFGIGLYLCSTILNLHNSKLEVESETAKGSTFSFSLAAYNNGLS